MVYDWFSKRIHSSNYRGPRKPRSGRRIVVHSNRDGMRKPFRSVHCGEESVRCLHRKLRYDIEVTRKSIGHRINSGKRMRTRRWSTARLKEKLLLFPATYSRSILNVATEETTRNSEIAW
jgi:hypothetical protein